MGKHIIFNGRKYFADINGRYYINDIYSGGGKIGRKKVLLHRAIWEFYNGEIPEGYCVHHLDGNTQNNDISNLGIMENSKHCSVHSKIKWLNEEYREQQTKNLDKARILASKWHKSSEAKEFHKRIGKLSWENKKLYTKNCEYCGKEYQTPFPTRSHYCERKCNLRRRYRLKTYAI